MLFSLFLFFFFQAEDGIRDYKVTGVQTCALPISCNRSKTVVVVVSADDILSQKLSVTELAVDGTVICWNSVSVCVTPRSEERRVGKEGRSRGARGQGKQRKRRHTGHERGPADDTV